MAATKKNGTSLLLYTGSDAIAASKSHSLSVNSESIDVTTKDSAGWKDILPGLKSWTVDCEGLVAFDNSFNYEYLLDALRNRTKLSIKLETTVVGDERLKGDVYVTSVELSAPQEDAISFTASFEGTGALTHETIT